MNQKGISSIVIILIVVGLLAVAGGVYYFAVQKPSQPEQPVLPTQPEEQNVTSTQPEIQPNVPTEPKEQPSPADETADWKTYRNEKYGYEVKYPSGYKFEEIPIYNPTGLAIFLPRGTVIVHEIDSTIININLPDDCMFTSSILEDKNMLSFVGTKEINRINFYYYKNYLSQHYLGGYCGMSSGCQYLDVYRTLYKGKCYEIKYVRFNRVYSAPDEYKKATEEEMQVPDVFNQIFSTFKFIE